MSFYPSCCSHNLAPPSPGTRTLPILLNHGRFPRVKLMDLKSMRHGLQCKQSWKGFLQLETCDDLTVVITGSPDSNHYMPCLWRQCGCIGTREYSKTQASNPALGHSVTPFPTVHSEQANCCWKGGHEVSESGYYDQSITKGLFSVPS